MRCGRGWDCGEVCCGRGWEGGEVWCGRGWEGGEVRWGGGGICVDFYLYRVDGELLCNLVILCRIVFRLRRYCVGLSHTSFRMNIKQIVWTFVVALK